MTYAVLLLLLPQVHSEPEQPAGGAGLPGTGSSTCSEGSSTPGGKEGLKQQQPDVLLGSVTLINLGRGGLLVTSPDGYLLPSSQS